MKKGDSTIEAVSSDEYKKDTKEYLIQRFNKGSKILDIGVGAGTYHNLLKDYFNYIDGVEVFAKYIKQFNLDKKYNNIYNCDILDFEFDYYDIIIMGDVLEHIKVTEAQKLVKSLYNKCEELIVVVPYHYKQDKLEDNKYAKHWQDDLEPDVMEKRFPELLNIFGNERSGVYVKNRNINNNSVL